MKRLSPLLLVVIFTTLGAGTAQADVAPPPDYVESCTVENHQRPGVECLSCGDAYHAEPDACQIKHAADRYRRSCRTSGASVWDEVWCRPAQPGPPTPSHPSGDPTIGHQPAKSGSCGACAVGGRSNTTHAPLALMGLILVATGRRRSRRATKRCDHD